MDKKIQILYYSEGWGLGGIERFIINTVQTLDKEKFQFDIFCTHDWDSTYDSIINFHHGHRFTVFKGTKPNLVKRLFSSTIAWKRLLQRKHYDIVHINTMNGTGFLYAQIAKKCGVPEIVVHAHNSTYGSSHRIAKYFAHVLCSTLYKESATLRLACSQESGKFIFGDKPFTLIQNGTDIDRFTYNAYSRKQIRKRLAIPESAITFGSIARLAEAKNPLFQVEILRQLHILGIPSYLILAGSGPLKSEIEELAKTQHLEEWVKIPGPTSKPEEYYSALDVMTLPSTFEGFPMSIAEAAASGLPCIVSDGMPTIHDNRITQVPLPVSNAYLWAKEIKALGLNTNPQSRRNFAKILHQIGYSNTDTTQKIEKLYIENFNKL